MAHKDELKDVLAEIKSDMESNRKLRAKDEQGEFHLIKVYPDHEVEIEWSRERGEV